MTRWLTGHTSLAVEVALAHRDDCGLMAQPKSYGGDVLDRWQRFAVDCGAWGGKFTPTVWCRYLAEHVAPRAGRCLFVVVPDVYGDRDGTLELWPAWSYVARPLAGGAPLAFVAQPGTTPAHVPAEADVVFLGGPDEWRLSEDAWRLVGWARSTGRDAHVGAVNSATRLVTAAMRGATSADGTFIGWGPDKNLPQVLRWMDRVALPRLDLWPVP